MTIYYQLQKYVTEHPNDWDGITQMLAQADPYDLDRLLVYAASHNQPKLTQLLLEHDADPLLWGGQALAYAIMKNHDEVIEALLPTNCLETSIEFIEYQMESREFDGDEGAVRLKIIDVQQLMEAISQAKEIEAALDLNDKAHKKTSKI